MQENNSTKTSAFLKFIKQAFLSFLIIIGLISLPLYLSLSVLEYNNVVSDLDFSEVFFLIALIYFLFRFYKRGKLSKDNWKALTKKLLITLGGIILILNAICLLVYKVYPEIIYEPLASVGSVLMVLFSIIYITPAMPLLVVDPSSMEEV